MSLNYSSLLTCVYDDSSARSIATLFSNTHGLALPIPLEAALENRQTLYFLNFSENGVYVSWFENPKKPIKLQIDFIQGANAHRRLFGGGKSQMIAKAVGVQTKFKPSILDATAGQGGDAFVFASLGCSVDMVERSPIAHALLDSALSLGLRYAESADSDLYEIFARMRLCFADSVTGELSQINDPSKVYDVVYLDPMFPERKKSAAVKKEMRIFHDLVGQDDDADALLEQTRKLAKYRVVVKRPKGAPFLANSEPSYQIKGKSTRFDIYVNMALPDV